MKAIALMSGGLDSNVAVKMLHEQGIEIMGVHFTGPFCTCNRGSGGCIHYARKLADEIGIKFQTLGLGSEYLEIVKKPKHGYGSGINPCLDCRILMFRRAKKMMDEEGASFIMTGEVLGQRPMSQLSDKLKIIERESGLEGLILRPLSAKMLPETTPEKEGWVDREKLLSIEGRGRKEQIDLAASLEVGDYPCPAGGCLLTDKNFARRMRDQLAHGDLEMSDIGILKTGRHFRINENCKLVVGRNKEENDSLRNMIREGDVLLTPADVMGPDSVIRGEFSDADLNLCLQITASYCDGDEDVSMTLKMDDEQQVMVAERHERSDFAEYAVHA